MRQRDTAGENHGGRNTVTILFVAFVYGLLHALGPGHRKTVVFSYFLQDGARLRTGLLAGLLMAITHAGSAIALCLIGYYVLSHSVSLFVDNVAIILERISFGAIIAFGLYQLIEHVGEYLKSRRSRSDNRNRGRAGKADFPSGSTVACIAVDTPATPSSALSVASSTDSLSDQAQETNVDDGSSSLSGTRLLILSLTAGLVPCPGVSMLMLFSISLGVVTLGVWSSIAMSLGMAVTLSGVAIGTVFVRRGIVSAGKGNEAFGETIHTVLEVTGATLMVLFGIFMLI